MATIQLKRKTTSGTGPLIGNNGTVKAGEPLVDLNGGNLYISKADKVASNQSPLTNNDYLEYLNKPNTEALIKNKIDGIGLGTAAKKNTGTSSGNIPVLNSSGKLPDSVIPAVALTNTFTAASESEMLKLTGADIGDVCIRTDLAKTFILQKAPYSTLANWLELRTPADKVSSVNGKTGAVNISLSELGGVSASAFNAHKGDSTHLTAAQKEFLDNAYISTFWDNTGISWTDDQGVANSCIPRGLVGSYREVEQYGCKLKVFSIAVNGDVVLSKNSLIDGGSY